MSLPFRSFLAAAVLVTTLALAPGADARETIATLRKADQDWLRVFAAKDLDRSVGFCDEAGSVLAPNAPRAAGRAAIRELFAGYFALPDLEASWQPTDVRVAKSGEIGYTTGAYRMSFTDPAGKTTEDHGKYVTVWERQDDGTWRVLLDVFNTDVPLAGASPKTSP